jgi:hypothetical protein
MLADIFAYEYFWTLYWVVAFNHALIYIKRHGGADSSVEAFWTTVFLTGVFPIVGVFTLYEISAAILFFILKPSNRGPRKEAELEAKDLLDRVKSNVTKRLLSREK